jgi:hypothetical protein
MRLLNKKNNMEQEIKCHDCGVPALIQDEETKNGVIVDYEKDGEKIQIFKCNQCFARNKKLENFQACEVYSRVVGYIRPVKQWHSGKQEEFADRKEYQV